MAKADPAALGAVPYAESAATLDADVAARAALGACSPWHELTVDGVRLAYDDEGSGVPIVCLHAIGHGASDFAGLRARWRARCRVIAIDWPGQGASGPDREPPSARRYEELLAGVAEALGLQRVVLIGNSIGGAAALRYAASHPQRVERLVLENPGGLDRPDFVSRTAIAAMVRFFGAGARRARWFPTAFAAYYRMVLPNRAAAQQRERIVRSAYAAAPLLQQAWRGFGEPSADLRGLISQVRCPVLFAWATRDRFVQLGRSLPSIQRFADARLERFRAGHAAHLESPEAFEATVLEFLGAPVSSETGQPTAVDSGR